MTRADIIPAAAKLLHTDQLFEAARLILDWSENPTKPKTTEQAIEPIAALIYGVLNEGYYEEAAALLWPASIFTPEPRCTRMVWKAIKEYSTVLLQGSSSMSKTYGAGVRFFLDWLRDPEYTTVKVLGPSEQHLQDNLFSHLVTLHRGASIPLPGIIGDLFIGLDLRARRGSISGTVVPLGRRGAGRLQGVKRFPRKKPHPVFGPLSRVRVLIDECEKVPLGIWGDLDNIVSNVEGVEGLKIALTYNPEFVGGPVYQRAEPRKGWQAFNEETDEEWDTPRGWHVVRLNAETSENVVQNKVIYPGLQTREGLDKLAQSSGGTSSSGYQTFGKAVYPIQGTALSVISAESLIDFRAKVFWYEKPKLCAAVDSALEGGDPAIMATGNFGMATGVEFAPSLLFPIGRTLMFKDAKQKQVIRNLLLVESLLELEKGDTVFVAQQIQRVGKSMGLDPGWLMLDRTGNGAGVHDLLKTIWSPDIMGVNYSESPTHTKILSEDTHYCDEDYDRVYSVLWFAFKRWREASAVLLNLAVPTEKLFAQFTGRQYAPGKKNKVESKRDYKKRNEGQSPNEADATHLLLHGVRKASGFVPSLVGGTVEAFSTDVGPVVRVSVTDRMRYLE